MSLVRKGQVELLVSKTLTELGVHLSDLHQTSQAKVYVRCTNCGEEFIREFCNLRHKHICPAYNQLTKTKWCHSCQHWLGLELFGAQQSLQCTACHKANAPIIVDDVDVDDYVRLEVKLNHADSKLPFRKRVTDAGYDVHSIDNAIIPAHGTAKVNTGLSISPPAGAYYSIEGRSSLWIKGIIPFRGIIDGTFQGPLIVVLINNSDSPYEILKNDRIAQLIMHRVINADFTVVNEFSPVEDGRQADGFGSTGK